MSSRRKSAQGKVENFAYKARVSESPDQSRCEFASKVMSSYLDLVVEDGLKLKLDFMWLRDHCRCDDCYNSSNANRIVNILDIPNDISIKSHSVENAKLLVVCKSTK